VLTYSRVSRAAISLKPVSLEKLVNETIQQYPNLQAPAAEISIEGPLPEVLAEESSAAQCFSNLLGNAIKFTSQGAITLELSLTEDRRPQINVSDTGVGIDAEYLPRIFDEFFQLRNPERDPTKGTGLGLTICKRLLDAMEGQLEVKSEPGQGTTFTITLPASCILPQVEDISSAVQPRPPASHSDKPLRGMRVLLVEDHAPTRSATLQLLQREGAQVAEAATGAQAVQLARQFDPHVLLLDMMLPDRIGTEVLCDIRGQNPIALRSVIIMTGDVTDDRIREIQSMGVTAFLPKPIKVADLVSILIARHTTGNGDSISVAQDHADD
jgi:CheY-like chemotaxis protein